MLPHFLFSVRWSCSRLLSMYPCFPYDHLDQGVFSLRICINISNIKKAPRPRPSLGKKKESSSSIPKWSIKKRYGGESSSEKRNQSAQKWEIRDYAKPTNGYRIKRGRCRKAVIVLVNSNLSCERDETSERSERSGLSTRRASQSGIANEGERAFAGENHGALSRGWGGMGECKINKYKSWQ